MSFVGKKIRDSQANTFNYVYEGAFVVIYVLRLWNIIETTKKNQKELMIYTPIY